MNHPHRHTRRRFLRVAGLAGAAALTVGGSKTLLGAASAAPFWRWRGVVLGAEAEIVLHGLPQSKASRLTRACFEEMRRLEKIFSLYEPDSVLCRLNREGVVHHPPRELVQLLEASRRMSERTGGAFDVTVQPLWQFFRDAGGQKESGREEDLAAAMARVDYRAVSVTQDQVRFAREGMKVTFNGIAQGWITDRVVDFLHREGVRSTLVNLGEYRALGRHPEGRPWNLGIRGAGAPADRLDVVPLQDAALAVSAGHGHFLLRDRNHLIHPRTGQSPAPNRVVAVVAPTATEADALSTACAVVDDDEARSFVEGHPVILRIHT